MSEPVPYVFVAGSGYSGSTLLALLLGSHPDVATIGEMGPDAPWAGRALPCSCGRTVASCPFLVAVGSAAEVDVDRGDLRLDAHTPPALRRLLFGHLGSDLLDRARDRVVARTGALGTAQDAFARRTATFARAALERTGARVFADTTKSHHHLRALTRSRSFDLRAIHLTRDPRAFAASSRRRAGVGARRAARAWVREQLAVERVLAGSPRTPSLHVRYEDLCSDPERTSAALWSFIAVKPWSPPEILRPAALHLIGNDMRLASEVRIACDERWRGSLSTSDRAAIERVAWPTASRFGYAP